MHHKVKDNVVFVQIFLYDLHYYKKGLKFQERENELEILGDIQEFERRERADGELGQPVDDLRGDPGQGREGQSEGQARGGDSSSSVRRPSALSSCRGLPANCVKPSLNL